MEFTEVVRRRHMVRKFTGEPVSPESLDAILRNAVRGPSAGFSQARPSSCSPTPRTSSASGRRRRPARDVVRYGRW